MIRYMKTIKVKELKSFTEKYRGLIGAQQINPIYFKTRFGIHTFGVKYPIDVLVLDENKSVIKMVQHLKPNRIFLWNPIYENVVELPEGRIRQDKIKLADEITLEIIWTQ